MVWRYLDAVPGGQVKENPECLLRKLVRHTGKPMNLGMLLTCLDIFADVQLLQLQWSHKYITIRLIPTDCKADLNESRTMQRLRAAMGQ